MTDFQKELVSELRMYALDYVKLGTHLHEHIESFIMEVDDDNASYERKMWTAQYIVRNRENWLSMNNVLQTLYNERETWKALITSFEEEES